MNCLLTRSFGILNAHQSRRSTTPHGMCGFATLFLFAVFANTCAAQVIIGPGRTGYIEQAMSTVDLPSDRTMARGIERAKDRIAEGEFSQAIRFLDEVLSGKQDSFIAVGETGEHVGLKETASNMIRDLPPDGREMYESTFGGVARKKLKDAVAAGDITTLREVAQHYFYTPAGYEAALLVAQREADSGRHLSAGLLYDQLLNTPDAANRLNPQLTLLATKSRLAMGENEEASKALANLNTLPGASIKIAGQKEQLPSLEADRVNWFMQTVGSPEQTEASPEDEWLMPRGNAARNGHADGGLPHVRVRWEARLLSHPQFETIHDELWSSLEQRRQPLPSAGTPLAIGNTIIATTAHNVVAVDFRTGKRVWQTQPQRISEFEQLVNSSGENGPFDTTMLPAQAFARRVWDDYLYNCVSSDGERVFVIRDLKLPDFNEHDTWALPFPGAAASDGSAYANRLCAYDLATQGKLVWEIDGAVDSGELAGAYFLGAPVAVDHNLYCLAEIKSAIHVVAIEQQTGKVAWLQQLAGLQNAIQLDPLRRLQAAMPSYNSGILVCPTGAGVVIGINLEKNALAWAYQYETNRNPMAMLRRDNGRINQQTGQWLEASAILADGCVLLSPPESGFLHCLDLVTGKFRWKIEKGDGMFVAGVEAGRALVVGLKGLTAINLPDGKPAWQQPLKYPSEAMPSGRGFFSEGKYFLPLTSAEIIAVDLASGDIVERTRSRAGTVLGNLISHEGAILSQNGKFLDRFDQIDVLRDDTESRLAENPDDFEALRTLGELTYNEGKLARAIELLQRAYKLSAEDPRTREVLGECLLEAIEQDFSAYQDRLPQLREILAESPAGALTLARIEAQGLLDLDEPWQSFEACLRIHEATIDRDELFQIDPNHQSSAASWLRAQLAAVWDRADSADRDKIAKRLADMLGKLREPGEALDSFVETFSGIGDVADNELIRRARALSTDNKLLAAQQIYLDYVNTDGPARGEAVASCARMLHDRGLARLAEPFDALLAGPLSEVDCLNGKTGRECLELGQTSLPLYTLDWPYGKVEVDQPPQTDAAAPQRVHAPLVEVRLEQSDSVLERCNLYFSMRVGELIIRDSVGREVFRQTLGDEERQIFNHSGIYGSSRGNLVILSLGQQITAIDTSANSEAGTILWRKGTTRNSTDRFLQNRRNGIDRPGSNRTLRTQADGKWIGVIGPITRESCVYQDQRGLCCVDSLTGKTRWIRTNSPNACQLFGDDQIVIAVEEGSVKAQAYSMLDGRSLGEVFVPLWQQQLATRGLDVVAWERNANGRMMLSSRDATSGTVSWHQEFARGSQVDVALNRIVAVVEPTGRYIVVDAQDGSTVVDHEVEPIPALKGVHLFAGTDQFVVAAEIAVQRSAGRSHTQYNPAFDFLIFDGQLMAFNAQSGAPLWVRPAEVRQESLMLSQPVDAPIITFVGSQNRQSANGTQPTMKMLLLEKASGRALFANDALPHSANHLAVTANDESKEVLVAMANRLVRLKFTNAPRPPEPPATYQATPVDKQGLKGLYGIIQGFMGEK